jgi:hypothetical protein
MGWAASALGDFGMVKARGDSAGAPKKRGKKMQARTRQDPMGAEPQIDPRIQLEIGKHLRAHYDNVINEPVPDKFMQLLEKLERSIERKG